MLPFDIVTLIKAAGYMGVFAIIFAESGILAGFFLPGDSLLFTAGFLASQGYFNIIVLMVLAFLGAVIGDSVGYQIGKRFGPAVFRKEKSRFFRKDYVRRTQEFFERRGSSAIILARFVPFIRTITPVFAGVGSMRYSTFLMYNIVGGLLWAVGLTALGYLVGGAIPNIDHYLLPIIAVIIIISIAPTAWQFWKHKN